MLLWISLHSSCPGLLSSFRTQYGTCLPGPGLLCLPFLSISTWRPGGMAILDQPMYHLCPQHGNVEKQTVWSGETPPGPPDPKEWQ